MAVLGDVMLESRVQLLFEKLHGPLVESVPESSLLCRFSKIVGLGLLASNLETSGVVS